MSDTIVGGEGNDWIVGGGEGVYGGQVLVGDYYDTNDPPAHGRGLLR